ncbi:MAG TPA: glycosyltransferase family 1 protein [Nitrolancea sp.]|nr:glycosyltransferase family 1 protein [Nitrolancea sp.]
MGKQPATTPTVVIDGRILAYRRGGIPRYITGITRHLPTVAPDLPARLLINRPVDGLKLPASRVRTPPHHRFEVYALGLELALMRPSLIHSPDFISPICPGIPRVVTVHDLAFLNGHSLLAPDSSRYYGQIFRAIRRADRVITVSQATAQQVIRHLGVPEQRIRVIHNGVDDRFFTSASEPALEIVRREFNEEFYRRVNTDRPLVLVVGTIEPRKRHRLLIQAVRFIAKSHPSLQPLLVIVGQPGWQCEPIIAEITSAASTGDVCWLPEVSDVGLQALYQLATLLAIPSLDEGFGLPAAEAMAAGLPVIASARGALPEVIGDAGVLVEEETVPAWAESIEVLIEDAGLRTGLAARGRARASAFRWERAATETASVYREVLNQ